MASFAHEISDDPVIFSLLQLINHEPGEFCSAEPASKENGDHRVIAFAT